MQLIADHEVRDDAVVVRFEGEVDMAVADDFASHLKAGLDEASSGRTGLGICGFRDRQLFGGTATHARHALKNCPLTNRGPHRNLIRIGDAQ